jgi:hypothetical protein
MTESVIQGVQKSRKQSDEDPLPSVSIEGVEVAEITLSGDEVAEIKLPGAETDSIDNGAKATAEKKQTTQRNKQIAIREFWCAEQVLNRWVTIESVQSTLNVADIMTKPLHEPTFRKLRGWLRGTDWPEAGLGPHVCFD